MKEEARMAPEQVLGLKGAERAALFRRPRWKTVAQTIANVLVYAVAGLLVTTEELGPLRFVIWPFMGFVLAGNLAAAHDCFHNSHLDSKLANRIAGALWCVFVLTNFSALKHAHMVHHRYTRAEGDSEAPFVVPTVAAYVRFLSLSPLALPRAAYRSVRILGGWMRPPHLGTDSAYRNARFDAAGILTWLAVAGTLTAIAPSVMVFVYWVPLVFFPPMAIAVAMPEHHRCAQGPDVFASTRTTKSNWLARMLIWNSNYHVEHHLYPGVPSCNLPSLHRALNGRLENCSGGYLGFHLGLLRDLARSRPSR
jgi:fatty acid desaturase